MERKSFPSWFATGNSTLTHFGKGQYKFHGAGGLAYWLMALVTLAENPGSIPSTHTAANNHLGLQFKTILFSTLQALWIQCTWFTDIRADKNTHTHKEFYKEK